MWKIIRPAVLASAGLLLQFAATSSQAGLVVDTVKFETQNQSMWSAGGSGSVSIEQFLGTRWGTYRETGDNPLADLLGFSPAAQKYQLGGFIGGENTCVGVDSYYGCVGFRADTTTGASLVLTTSGQVGVYVGAELFGGGVDVALPMNATVNLPDQVTAGEFFNVATTGETLAQGAGTTATITANAPSFRAFIDGVLDTENHFFAEGCLVGNCADGEFDVNINLGRFNLVQVDSSKADPWSVAGIDLTGVPLAKFTKRESSPLNLDGVDETPPIDPTPSSLKPAVLLQVEISGLQDKTGGTLQNGNLVLSGDDDVFDANLNLTGFAEAFVNPPGSPAILKNKLPVIDFDPIPIPSLGITYTLANVEVGPVLSVRQSFDLTPGAAVRLQFDVPVTRMELVPTGTQQVKVGENCTLFIICTDIFEEQPIFAMQPVKHNDGIIEIVLGEIASLAFNDGIGQLVNRTYVMSDSTLSNTTSLLARLEATVELGCLEVPLIGNGCLFEETWPTGDLSLGSNQRTFDIGGFNEIGIAEVFAFNGQGGPGPGPGPAPVPEPGTWTLLLLGLVAIFSGSRRKTFLRFRRAGGTR